MIFFPCWVSEVVINQAEKISTAWGELRSDSPRVQGYSPPSDRRQCNGDHAVLILEVVFSVNGLSDWVLISRRLSRLHCSLAIRSAQILFFKVPTKRLRELFFLSAFSSTAKTLFCQSQCESCHSRAFTLLKKTVQSQRYSAGRARARGVAVPWLKSEP